MEKSTERRAAIGNSLVLAVCGIGAGRVLSGPCPLSVLSSETGKGHYLDDIFIERLRRTLKYECVYLHAWETGS